MYDSERKKTLNFDIPCNIMVDYLQKCSQKSLPSQNIHSLATWLESSSYQEAVYFFNRTLANTIWAEPGEVLVHWKWPLATALLPCEHIQASLLKERDYVAMPATPNSPKQLTESCTNYDCCFKSLTLISEILKGKKTIDLRINEIGYVMESVHK